MIVDADICSEDITQLATRFAQGLASKMGFEWYAELEIPEGRISVEKIKPRQAFFVFIEHLFNKNIGKPPRRYHPQARNGIVYIPAPPVELQPAIM